MNNEIETSRDAIRAVYRAQNLAALNAAVERGDWTRSEADLVHEKFMSSDLLQTLITRDAQTAEAMLTGKVH